MAKISTLLIATLVIGLLGLAACSRPATSSLFTETSSVVGTAATPQIQVLRGDVLVVDGRHLRLVDVKASQEWNSRGHFFSAAAEAMRRLLIEKARRKKRLRHGGGRHRVDLDTGLFVSNDANDSLLALDDALSRLAAEEPEAANVVKLRYFAGLTIEETAAAMNISVRTVNRHWTYARAWLYEQLR